MVIGDLAVLSTIGRGRIVGLILLVIVLALQGFVSDRFYAAPRRALFDFYARTLPRSWHSTPVVIVEIDEASLKRYGQWPWPRQRVASLVGTILAGHPAALGIDILMTEPDRLSPAYWMAEQGTTLPSDLEHGLEALPDHDETLARIIRGAPVVLAVAGERTGRAATAGPVARVFSRGGNAALWVPRFDSSLRSIPILDVAAAGHGMISVDKDSDGIVRQLPSVSAVGSELIPSLSLDMIRLAAGSKQIDLQVGVDGLHKVRVGNVVFPTDPSGVSWLYLSPNDGRRFVSAADVLEGKYKPAEFDRRFVLLGLTALGLVDMPTTALGPMPGVELHAQFLENIFDANLAARPRWAPKVELCLTFFVGLLFVLLLPKLKYRWYPFAALVPIVFFVGGGLFVWHSHIWLIDSISPAIGFAVVFMGLIGGGLAEADAHRRHLRRALEQQKLKEARLDGELQAAQRIQMGILPQTNSLLPDDRFDLDAAMIPARVVGGDLYDFFKIDDDHLFIAIGDVSGKGIPASLFMALGKSLCKSCALRGPADIGKIVVAANAEISRDNVEMLFITLFAALLDLRSGLLSFCNAGHDAPFIIRSGEPPAQLKSKGGPPLCVIEEFPYATEFHQLVPGEILVLTTDGITEAMDGNGSLMGCEQALRSLAGLPVQATAKDASKALFDTVALFVKDAEASDDITLLAVKWVGSSVRTCEAQAALVIEP